MSAGIGPAQREKKMKKRGRAWRAMTMAGWTVIFLAGFARGRGAAGEPPSRPFMLWTADEARSLGAKLQAEPWAKERLERMLKEAPAPKDRAVLENYFLHLVTGDREAEKFERQVMLHFAEVMASPRYAAGRSVEIGGLRGCNYDIGFRYDLFGGPLSAEEKRVCEAKFNQWSSTHLKSAYPHGWEHPDAMCSAMMALATLDKRLIQAAFEAPSGVKAYFDGMADGYFSPDGCNPDPNAVGAMWLWCRAVEKLGRNELGFGYTGKGGGTMRRLLEGYYLAGDPRIEIPGGTPFYGRSAVTLNGRLRRSNFVELPPALGTGSLAAAKGGGGGRTLFVLPQFPHPRDVFRAPLVIGRLGESGSYWPPLLPFRNELFYSYDKRPRDLVGLPQIEYNPDTNPLSLGLQLPLVFELAHQKWPEAGFAYFLCRMRPLEDGRYYPSLFWGLDPIPAADAKPPAVKSAVFPRLGMALLRAEEGPGFWESPAPFAVLRLTEGLGEELAGSALSLHSLQAFNRPLYRYVRPSRGVPSMGDSGKAHNTVVVDNAKRAGVGVGTVRQRFEPAVKFVAVRSEPPPAGQQTKDDPPRQAAVIPGVEMERALALTREYLLDVYRLAGDQEHTYDWIVHALGSAQPDRPEDWKSTEALNETLGAVGIHSVGSFDQRFTYRMKYGFGDQRLIDAKEATWSLNVVQTASAADKAATVMGDEWYGRRIGVRVTMLGEPGAKAFFAREMPARKLTAQEEAQLQAIRFPLRLKPRDGGYDKTDHERTEIPILPEAGKKEEPPPAAASESFRPLGQAAENLPETGGVVIIAERRAARTMFVALHEPFENAAWKIREFRRLQQTEDAVAAAVRGREPSAVDDRLLVRMGAKADEPLTLGDGAETFTFKGFAFVRVGSEQVSVCGELTAMKVKVQGTPKLLVNGEERKREVRDGWLSFGL
jgi:hypothetical protein